MSQQYPNNNNNLVPTTTINKNQIEKQIELWKKKLDEYKCPISQQIMIHPVIIETGQTFEKQFIEQWLKNNYICPKTKKILKSKNFIPCIDLKSIIDKKIKKFINNVIVNVKIWQNDGDLINICKDLIDYSIGLILKDENCKDLLEELQILKCDNLLLLQNISEDLFFNEYNKIVKSIKDNKVKLLQLNKIQNKINNKLILQEYCNEVLNILFKIKENDFKKDEYLNNILEKLINIDLIEQNKNIFINVIKNLFKENNLTNINLQNLLQVIKNYPELAEETNTIYLQLYKNNNDIIYLEKVYELNTKNKEIEQQLLNSYLEQGLNDKYIDLYIKINKTNPFNVMIFKLIESQNKKFENTILNLEDKFQNQINNITLQYENKIKNLEYQLQSTQSQLEQQILNNIKTKLPNEWKDKFTKIITIKTPLNIQKEEHFFSDMFEACGFNWNLGIFPKGNKISKKDALAIFLELNEMKHKLTESEEKEVISIKTKILIANTNFDDTSIKNIEHVYSEVGGFGNSGLRQLDYVPFIENDKQIFKILIGIQLMEIKYK
ncbi:hypothetical protein ABK040_002642 [Willaertia magna]